GPLVVRGPAPRAIYEAGPVRPDRTAILGVQPGVFAGPDRACLDDRVDGHDPEWDERRGGGREGVQTGRGDLRQVPDRPDLTAGRGATGRVGGRGPGPRPCR